MKWLLAIPHYIVLAFLWIAFCVLTLVAAFFAILFTGRYPRGIFDFNVGVLRWTWRVGFYSYWAIGTDRYPPFTLGEEPDYPARLEVAYPEQLTAGSSLVKWLLAIPHLILVGLFVGGWGWGAGDDWGDWGFAGLVGILVLIGCVILLFTGRYPPTLFNFALGLDRWSFRVGRLRRPDDRQVPTLPPGHGATRARNDRADHTRVRRERLTSRAVCQPPRGVDPVFFGLRYSPPHGAWRSLVSALVWGTERSRVRISAPRLRKTLQTGTYGRSPWHRPRAQ